MGIKLGILKNDQGFPQGNNSGYWLKTVQRKLKKQLFIIKS